MLRSPGLALLCFALIGSTACAAPPVVEAVRRSSESVTLIVHSAADCPICKAWRESSTGLPLALQLPDDWPQLNVVLVERASLRGSETESLYPAALQPLYEARRDRYQLSPPVPLFELLRNGQLVSRHAGLHGWSEGTLPELRQLRAGSGANPAKRNH